VHLVIGKDAVEIEDQRSHDLRQVIGAVQARLVAHQHLGNLEINRVVDFQAPLRGSYIHGRLPEEAVPGLLETRHPHNVHCAGLEVLRLALLAQRAAVLGMIDANRISTGVLPPEKVVEGCHSQGGIGILVEQRLDRPVDIFDERQRRRALQESQQVRVVTFGFLEMFQGV
jgi:hypothetical protein